MKRRITDEEFAAQMAEQRSATEVRIAPLLNAHPFEVIAWEFSKAFGNFYVDYRLPEFLLRLVQDRSQLFLDVASLAEPENWWPSSSIRELFTGERFTDLPELEVQAQIVIDHYGEIARAFEPACWPATRERLDALAEAERRRSYPMPGDPPLTTN